MSILFFIISGLLFGYGFLAVVGSHTKNFENSDDVFRTVSLIFIASGVFAIAGVLA